MTDRRLQQLFDELFDLDPEERARRLDLLGPADAELRVEIEDLLRRSDSCRTEDLLPPLMSPTLKLEGFRIGPYRVVRQLGEGGMGAVYLVEREDVGLRAALKLPRHGVLGGQGQIERFLRERRVLAALAHPGIARLLDAGRTDQGLPYFVMEYVAGLPLDRHCDEKRLPIAARVQLFRDAVGAVAAAHAAGIVHRDLKPSNILVTKEGQIRLLDFGIAKITRNADDPAAGESTGDLRTATGALLATPEYAAPEQVSGGTIGYATDVYSLGVVLHELLTGQRPHVLKRAQRDAVESPSTASVPVAPSRSVLRARSDPQVAADRASTTVKALARQLAGDLDVITMSCLATEPERRYPDAGALCADLDRYQTRRPIQARRPSIVYRTRIFLRRHRGEAMAAVVALAAVGVGVLSWTGRPPATGDAHGAVVNAPLYDVTGGRSCEGLPRGPRVARGLVTARRTAGELVLGIAIADGRPDRSYQLFLGSLGTDPGPCPPDRETGHQFQTDPSGVVQSSLTLPLSDLSERSPGDGFGGDSISVLLRERQPNGWADAFAALVPVPDMPGALSSDEHAAAARELVLHHGQLIEAEVVHRSRVNETPADPEAWNALADFRYHYNPYLGRNGDSAREDFERTLSLDPNHPNALVHLLYIAAREADSTEVDTLAVKLISRQLAVGGTLKQVHVLHAATTGTAAERRELIANYADSGYVDMSYQLELSVVRLAPNPLPWEFLALLLDPARPAPVRASAHLVGAAMELGRGRLTEAEIHLDQASRVVPSQALERRVLHAVQAFVPVDTARLVRLRDSLVSWAGPDQKVPMTRPFGPIHQREPAVGMAARTYLAGRIAERLGQMDSLESATRALDEIARADSVGRSLAAPLASELRARTARASGEIESALEHAFEIPPGTLRNESGYGELDSQHRLLIAELLVEAGRPREAIGWFEGLSQIWPWDTYYRGPVDLWLARLYLTLGESERAHTHATRFLEAWRGAEPRFDPLVAAADAIVSQSRGTERVGFEPTSP